MTFLRSLSLKTRGAALLMQYLTAARAFVLPSLVTVSIALGGCAGSVPARLTAAVTPRPVLTPQLQPTGLAPVSVKRRVQIVQLHQRSVASDQYPEVGVERDTMPEVEARLTALRIALERALNESGRYDVHPSSDTRSGGAVPVSASDMIHVSAELVESDTLTQVHLHISDLHASDSRTTFIGTGAPLERTSRAVFPHQCGYPACPGARGGAGFCGAPGTAQRVGGARYGAVADLGAGGRRR